MKTHLSLRSLFSRHLTALLVIAPLACTGDDSSTTEATSNASETTSASASSTTASTTDATAGTTAGTTTAGTTAGTTTDATTTTGATTTTASTTDATTGGPVACDPDNLPPEGAPCEMDGEYCSPGCEDPCQFCNVLMCTGGTWQNLEVFPAECLSCDEVCPSVVAPGCSGGPPDLDACLTGCQANEAKCPLEYHQMLACIGGAPDFSCDATQLPTVEGCEMQFATLYECIFP